MIASLRGTLVAVSTTGCVIDVSGVGYAVVLTPAHARTLQVGDVTTLATSLIVREDSMQLFGFESSVAQELFDALLTVSGVGPRSAMAVLSELPPVEVYSAVVNEDDAAFRRVSGIGPKTAKLIVVSLAGRLAGLDVLGISSSQTATAHSGSQRAESTSETIVRALTGLGWPERIAREAVTSVVAVNPSADSAVILREALAALSSARNLS